MNNNVLVVFKGSLPMGGAMTKRLILYCRGLMQDGANVQVVIPHASEAAGNVHNRQSAGTVQGVPYKYLSKSSLRSSSFLQRRIDDFMGYLRLLWLITLNKGKHDVLFIVDVRNFFLLFIALVAKVKGIKTVYELNEHPLVWFKPFKYTLSKRLMYPLLDGFVVISSNILKLVDGFKAKNTKVILVPIIIDSKEFEKPVVRQPDTNQNYIIHTGTLSEYQNGIVGMIKAVSEVLSRGYDLELYFTGNINKSADKNAIMALLDANEKLKSKIKFLGFLSEEDLAFYQKHSLCFIINKEDNLQNKYCFATKTGEYLATGNPVIVTNVGDMPLYFIDNINAFVVPYGDTQLLADKIIQMINNPEKCKAIGQEGQKLTVTAFDYKEHGARLNTFFSELIFN